MLAVVGWEGLASSTESHHQAPLSALLLSAVHPVTLYTRTQPSAAPSYRKQRALFEIQSAGGMTQPAPHEHHHELVHGGFLAAAAASPAASALCVLRAGGPQLEVSYGSLRAAALALARRLRHEFSLQVG